MSISASEMTLHVVRVSDVSIRQKIDEINEGIDDRLSLKSFKGFFLQSELAVNSQDGRSTLALLMESDSILIEHFTWNSSNDIEMRLIRIVPTRNDKSAGYDQITFKPGQNSNLGHYANLVRAVRKHFVVIESSDQFAAFTDEQKDALTERTAVLDKLQQVQQSLIADLGEFTVKQTKENQEHQRLLDDKYQQKLDELDSRRIELENEIEDKRKTLDDEKKKLDLRNNTTVRRSIRESVRQLLADRANGFELSAATEKHAARVMRSYTVLMCFFGALTAFYLLPTIFSDLPSLPIAKNSVAKAPSGPEWLDVVRLIRPLFPLLGFVITTSFFIKWLNSRAQRHADDEFMARQYELDFERASFVVEWAMEWAKEGREVPQYLIERLSRGLFDFEHSKETSATAADAIASALFGSASQLELEAAGNKVAVSRKGIKTLQKTPIPKEE